MEQEGFLLRNPGEDRVLLGPELLRLARNTDEQLLLREASRPIISDLVATVRGDRHTQRCRGRRRPGSCTRSTPRISYAHILGGPAFAARQCRWQVLLATC